jgi:hypothetical protein
MPKPASRNAVAWRAALFGTFMLLVPPPARADVMLLTEPDRWIEAELKGLSEGKTDEFARQFVKLIDKEASFETLSANLRPLTRLGQPAFLEKVSDTKYGSALREVVYLALYQRTNYIYFKFVLKKNVNGWLVTHFEFKDEVVGLFPKGFVGPQ